MATTEAIATLDTTAQLSTLHDMGIPTIPVMTATIMITVPQLGTVSEDSSACIRKKDSMTIAAEKLTDGGDLYATDHGLGYPLYTLSISFAVLACPTIPCYVFVVIAIRFSDANNKRNVYTVEVYECKVLNNGDTVR